MTRTLRKTDKVLLVLTIIFSLYGLFNIVTASSREAVNNMDQSIYYYFYRHLIIIIVAFILSFIVMKIPLKKYSTILPLAFFVILGLNIYLLIQGKATRGATNWIDLGFFNLQPSEVAKPLLILCMAYLFDDFKDILRNPRLKHFKVIALILGISLPIVLIVFLEKDLGTSFILFIIFVVLFLSGPIMPKEKLKVILIGVLTGLSALFLIHTFKGDILTDAQKSRFNFYKPCDNYSTTGYQVCNAFIALNKGGLLGVGIGKSSQKYSYIPEPHTDMVFSIISEENGLVGGTIIFLFYIIILYRIFRVAKMTDKTKERYICIGVGTYLFMHILVNFGGLFGLIPLTGVPLPFLSYGGSFSISLLVSLAIVQRVHIESQLKKGIYYAR